MNENRKTIDAYNSLLKILKVKNKQFEENVFNDFLEDQNLRTKQGQSFDINRCNEEIKKSIDPKVKQKFNVAIEKINETLVETLFFRVGQNKTANTDFFCIDTTI